MKNIDTDKIVALRKHYQLKQDDVAKALNIGRVTYIMREKYGSFTDDELNKLSELLKVDRSELIKKENSFTNDEINKLSKLWNLRLSEANYLVEPSALEMPSSDALYGNSNRAKGNMLSSLSRKETNESKTELPEAAKKDISEEVNLLNESEPIYQSKYITLLEDQLREKEEMIKELKEALSRLEYQMKDMFAEINYQNRQLSEFSRNFKVQLEKERNFSMKTFEQFMKKQKAGDKK
jgi:transcriptional regulator with XRE-family HTH domain